jgi:hypothetical protein
MWQCTPASSRLGVASTRRTASAAAPDLIDRPNFWSSVPVVIARWVCASTSGVTRSSTRWRPDPKASEASVAISSSLSTTMHLTPMSIARRTTDDGLALPCRMIRSAGNCTPAARVMLTLQMAMTQRT